MSETAQYDLLIVGGGINGAGIARDAAGRGLGVLLVEQSDLASATSSASSKLIHGGLRYLEHSEFRLVREALGEREVLLGLAPHLIWPLTFVLPHDASMRPAWMIRSGLFLYDHLAPRSVLPASRSIDLVKDPIGAPLRQELKTGYGYADCWVDDSRLVVLNALDARERGAVIRTRCRLVKAAREGSLWRAELDSGGAREVVIAQALVNATGPWVDDTLARIGGAQARAGAGRPAPHVRLVKGSHIVVPRLYTGEHAFILQNADKRVVFVIPYEGRYSLIGTTDVPYDGDPGMAAISGDEIVYLCRAAGRFLSRPPRPEDVVWSYSGVRPLYDDTESDPSAVTRDYVLELESGPELAPLLTVFGGKITTYRRLAEEAIEKLARPFTWRLKPWTARAPLPGGDMPKGDFEAFVVDLRRRYAWLPGPLARRLARAYGTRVAELLGDANGLADLGEDLGAGLTEREADYMIETEWALTAHDILWRRSKLGLHGGAALRERTEAWIAARGARKPL